MTMTLPEGDVNRASNTDKNADLTREGTVVTPNDNLESRSLVDDTQNELQGKKSSADTENYKDYNLCKRLRIDHPYRRRFIHTLWLFWAFVGLGWMIGQMGPNLPDLRLIVQQDLETASWLFTVFSIGYLVGSFVGGILYDRFNKLLLIVFSTLLMAVFTGALPWCRWFPLMIAVRFMSGLGGGGLDTGGNADLVSLWDEEGRPYMQALHFFFGFGGIISPLVSEPFLAKKYQYCLQDNSTESTTLMLNDSFTGTALYQQNATPVSMTTQEHISENATCHDAYGQTYIHYTYLIAFLVIGSSSVPFIVMYFKILCSKKPHVMAAVKGEFQRPDKLLFKLKIIFLLLLFGLMMFYCAVEDTFSGFLATFCINHLKWSKGKSSFASSVHWGAFSVGRFSGIFLIRFFRPVQLLGAYCLFLISSFIGLTIVSITFTTELVWLFVPLAGFSMSIIFPCIFTWTEESILKVSGKISSLFLIAASSGLMLNPLFLGYLMDNFSNLSFVYLLLGESCVCFILFLIIYILVKNFVTISKAPAADLNMEIVVSGQEMLPLNSEKSE